MIEVAEETVRTLMCWMIIGLLASPGRRGNFERVVLESCDWLLSPSTTLLSGRGAEGTIEGRFVRVSRLLIEIAVKANGIEGYRRLVDMMNLRCIYEVMHSTAIPRYMASSKRLPATPISRPHEYRPERLVLRRLVVPAKRRTRCATISVKP